MAEPVKITFLGGLGEIGRNCACIEVDGRIMLLDCGLMFPDADMLGIDLVLPDFTWLRDNADRIEGCIVTHGHEDHHGGLSFLLRELVVPDLRLGAHARPGPQPHRGGRPARPHRASTRWPTASAAGSARSTASSSPSPTRCPTASPPRSTRRRASILHTRRLQARPHAGRRPAHRPRPAWARSATSTACGSSWRTRPTPTSRATPARETLGRQGAVQPVPRARGPADHHACFASHIHRIQQIADAAIRYDRVIATMGMSMKKNVRLAREMGLLQHPREPRCVDIDDVERPRPGQGLRDLAPGRRASRCRRWR